ncbi:hypothetical protein AC1031_014316 [Aphanomyces cochlioides]|nr:hypothetical protein AC1031_014316 [Aphanomyces cochlioides]
MSDASAVMVELSLNCVVVGEETPFSIGIDTETNVGRLKDSIEEKNMYQFPAKKLELYHIDFRQRGDVGQQKPAFLCVSFANSFANAKIFGHGSEQVVDLSA